MSLDLFDLTGKTALVTGSSDGLGLAIARELAELMDGRLRVESRPGRTRFVLELPPDQRRVMRYLLRFDYPPTPDELARAVGIDKRELKEVVRSLAQAGLLRVAEGRIRPVTGKRTSRPSSADRWSRLDERPEESDR